MRKLLLSFGIILAISNQAQADTLIDAMNKGLQSSEVLAAAQHAFVASRQNLIITNSGNDLNGSVNVTGTQSWTDAATKAGGFDSSNSQKGTISLSKRIFDSGEGEARIQAAQLQLNAAKARYAGTEQAVLLNVTNAYLGLITARETVAISQLNLERLDAQTDAVRIRLDAGTATPTDVAQAESRLARAQSDLIIAQSDELVAEETYRSLVGDVPETLTIPPVPSNLPFDILEAETMAIAFHPDVMASMAAEQSAEKAFDVLETSVKPKVNFSVSAGMTQASTRAQEKDEVSATITLTSPLFATTATHAKSRETIAKLNEAKSNTAETKRRIALAARSAFQNYIAAAAQLDAVAAEVDAANLVLAGISSEVEFGLKTFLDELDAESGVNSALLRQVQTRQSVLTSAYRLKNALGQLSAAEFALNSDGSGLDDLVDPVSDYGQPFEFFSDFTGRLSFGQ